MALTVGELYVKLDLDSAAFSKALDKAYETLKAFSKDKSLKVALGIDLKDQVQTQLRDLQKGLSLNVGVKIANQAAVQTLSKDLATARTQVTQLGTGFSSLGSILRNALSVSIGNILTNPIQALLNTLGGLVSVGASFEQSMANVKAVLAPTAAEFESLSDKARQLGRDTQYTATESSNAMEMLAKNGLSATQILGGAVDATVAFAAAAGSDLATAADVATDAMLSFNLTADQLPMVVNQAVGAMNQSKFGVDDYRLALGQAGGAVGGLGVSLLDFNTILAATSNRFGSGSDAGTSFKTFLLRLNPVSNEAADIMRRLGIITADGSNRFFDAQGNIKPLIEVMKILQETMGNLSTEAKLAALKDIFGQDAIRTAIGFLDTSTVRFQELQDTIANTDAADQAATRMDTLNGAIKTFQSSLESIGITISESFAGGLTDIVRGATEVINIIDGVIQALQGNQEAFTSLPAPIQAVVIAIQELSSFFSSLIGDINSLVSEGLGNLESFFSGIAGAAFGWGSDAGNEFASGISGAIDSVIAAVSSIGEVLSYWLSPGSPPRVAPNIDKWGESAGNEFFKGLSQADFEDVSSFTKQIEGVFNSLVDSGDISETDAITGVIGSRESFADALNELRRTGSVSQDTFRTITSSAGNASGMVGELAARYFSMISATDKLTTAQARLADAQGILNRVQQEYADATAGIRAELEELRKVNEIARIDAEIAEQEKLANAIGGTGEIQAEAQRKIQELLLERQLAEKELEFMPRIDAAQDEVDLAQDNVDAAKEEQELAQRRLDITTAQIDAQKENNELLRKQLELLEKANEPKKGGGGGGGGGSKEIDKDKEAQDRYNYSLADTQGKLDILKDKLKGVEEGSAEYYNILGQINTLEGQRAKEIEKDAKAAEQAAEEKLKAERDYKYSIADTAGKMAILREELAKTEQGSADYYRILGDIAQLEKQSKPKGGSDGGIPGIDKTPDGTDPSQEDPIRKTFDDAKAAAEAAREAAARFREQYSAARTALLEFIAPFQPLIDIIKNNLVPILAGLATPALAALAGIIGGALVGALGALLSPIALVSVGVALLVAAWQSNFANIQGYTSQAMTAIQDIISGVLSIILSFWNEHGSEVMTFLSNTWNNIVSIVTGLATILFQSIVGILTAVANFINEHKDRIQLIIAAAWNYISNLISNVLAIIQNVIDTVLAAINGDWDTFWNELKAIAESLMNLINEGIRDGLAILLSFFGVNAEDTKAVWDGMWLILQNKTDEALKAIQNFLSIAFIQIEAAWETTKSAVIEVWDKLKDLLPESTKKSLDDVLTAIGEKLQAFYDAAKSVGTNIIDGIVKGIEEGIQSVIDAAKGMAQAAIDAAQGKLKEQSPSKVMYESGQNYTKGFVLGAISEMESVKALAGMVAQSIPLGNTATASMGNIYNTFSFTIDARGSNMDENQFRTIIRTEVNKLADRGYNRGR